jgi:hypothetical protein
MRISWRMALRMMLVLMAIALLWWRFSSPRRTTNLPIADLSTTNPLNRPGGAPVPAEAYEIYSALYAAPAADTLAFSEDSQTDIPQVGGSCLKPNTPEEHEMADAFVAANQLSHPWEQRFSIAQGYRLVSRGELPALQTCLAAHGHGGGECDKYKGLSYVRMLSVPGFDGKHARALVSVIKSCGKFCGTGGIFEVDKKGETWQRTPVSDFTRGCSWMF